MEEVKIVLGFVPSFSHQVTAAVPSSRKITLFSFSSVAPLKASSAVFVNWTVVSSVPSEFRYRTFKNPVRGLVGKLGRTIEGAACLQYTRAFPLGSSATCENPA